MNERDDFSNANVMRWTPHQMADRFKALKEALPGLGSLQATAVTQSVAHRDMTALDGFGRLAAYSM